MNKQIYDMQMMNATVVPGQVVTRQTIVEPAVRADHPQRVYNKKRTIFRAYQIIWFILGVVEIALGFRFVFKLLAANPYSGFVNLIYGFTTPLILPFSGILRSPLFGYAILEWSTVIAGVVYALVAYGIVHIMQLVKPVSPREVSEKVDNPT